MLNCSFRWSSLGGRHETLRETLEIVHRTLELNILYMYDMHVVDHKASEGALKITLGPETCLNCNWGSKEDTRYQIILKKKTQVGFKQSVTEYLWSLLSLDNVHIKPWILQHVLITRVPKNDPIHYQFWEKVDSLAWNHWGKTQLLNVPSLE